MRIQASEMPFQLVNMLRLNTHTLPVSAVVVVVGLLVVSAFPRLAISASKQLPSEKQVMEVVEGYFLGLPNYQTGDLISSSQVKGALQATQKLGWEAGVDSELADLALPDSHFLIKQTGSRKGQAFLRAVGRSGGFAQLDQLSETTDGKKHIKYLIGHRDGHLLITYMATTSGGKSLGRQMAKVKHGVNLNKPTGRIYTAEQLVKEIRQLYRSNPPAQGKLN